jgi:hypothetical protein
MEVFDGKIIIPTSVINSEDKIQEYYIKAFITGGGSHHDISCGLLVINGRFLNLIIEKKSEALMRKLAISGRIFDLKLEGRTYIGCIISKEKTVDNLQVEDCVFEHEIKMDYLAIKKEGE